MSTFTDSSTLSLDDSSQPVHHNRYYDTLPVSAGSETLITKPNVWRKTWAWIKPVYILDHLDFRSMKVVLPTFIQVWVTVILCTVPRTSKWFGNAGYLMQILGFILSDGGLPVCLNIILAFSSFVAMLIGWLFGVVALAIGVKIRGWPTVEEVAESLIIEGTCTQENVARCMMEQFFSGRYLDATASVVFAIALVIGIVFFGIISRVHKIARFVFICGCISLIINICLTVYFPVFIPLEIGLVVVKPSGVAFAVKIVVTCLVFPFTASSKYFEVATLVLSSFLDISTKNERFFSSMKPSEDSFSNYESLVKDIQGTRVKLSKIELFLSSTRFEFSYGRLSSGDAYEFSSRIKALLNTYSGYEYFYVSMQERKDLMKEGFYSRARHPSISDRGNTGQSKLYAAFSHTYKEVGKLESSKVQEFFKKKYLDESKNGSESLKDLNIVTGHIKEAHAGYLTALSNALKAARNWLADANQFRTCALFNYKVHSDKQKLRHAEIVEARDNLMEFIRVHEAAQNDLSMQMLEGMQGHEQVLSLISQTSFFLFLSKQVANQTLALLDSLILIDEKRPAPVLMWPSLTNAKPTVVENRGNEKLEQSVPEIKTRQRDPDSSSPQSPLQIIMWSFSKAHKTLLKEDYVYWFQCAMLVNFCAFPFYFKNSAQVCFDYKLVWFPIMCAVSTSQYSADSVHMFVTKVVYSFIGAVAGLVAWYISTGSGNGNYYGYAAVSAVLYFLASFYRHFSGHDAPLAAIMVAITPNLVLGPSWADAQNDASDLGLGWKVACVRFASVLAGLAVAFTTTLFPKVRSSKAAFRKKLAATLESVVDMQNKVCNFAMQRYDDPGIHIRPVGDKFSNDVKGLLLKLAAIRGSIKMINYEVPLTGAWPTAKYDKLSRLIVSITQLHYLHYHVLNQVEDTEVWIPHMINRAAWNQHEFMSQVVSLTYMASESLKLKIAMPEITTATLSIKHMEVLSEMWSTEGVSLEKPMYSERKRSESSHLRRRSLRNLDFESLLSHDGRLNVVALLITHLIYKQIDEAVLLVKSLVGEKYNFDMRMFEL